MPALPEEDRRFLADSLRELHSGFEAFALGDRALHGGPHTSNLLRTSRGLRWIDLDTVCRGPLEWDLAHLPEAAAAVFPEAEPNALAHARLLVSAEVAVWCWHTYGRAPEVDEAAHFHLDQLRASRGELRIVPFAKSHGQGFRDLVADTLREFGFAPDSELDPDLADPAAIYEAVWVALLDNAVVGSVALRRLSRRQVELKRMYLRPHVRGRGAGRRLLETALAWAREHRIETISLDTTERMEAARHLYEAYGFTRAPGEAPRQGQRRLLYELRVGE
jgi:GNAT superfamily N-acetyltransferase